MTNQTKRKDDETPARPGGQDVEMQAEPGEGDGEQEGVFTPGKGKPQQPESPPPPQTGGE